ncbi:hypothetical protein NPX13_g5840 [Xylaria arbuscula]|uniref:Uncharacterized protein n=1 Tax=Xylaria arbuscula TaxID=114810 RepID=A0A9W8NCY7_9PEZI|nr:hypothetical protein NPX13_g5840 [Xylaria arbuscula]
MGRTEPTVVKPPAAFRRDARAKRARTVINKVIPALLSAHPRARRGIERSELIVDPPRLSQVKAGQQQGDKNGEDPLRIDGAEEGGRKASGVRRGGGRRKVNSSLHNEDKDAKNASRSRIEEEGAARTTQATAKP